MLNQYYHIPERIYRSYEEEWTLEDLKRQDAANTDQSHEQEHDPDDIETEDAETKTNDSQNDSNLI